MSDLNNKKLQQQDATNGIIGFFYIMGMFAFVNIALSSFIGYMLSSIVSLVNPDVHLPIKFGFFVFNTWCAMVLMPMYFLASTIATQTAIVNTNMLIKLIDALNAHLSFNKANTKNLVKEYIEENYLTNTMNESEIESVINKD